MLPPKRHLFYESKYLMFALSGSEKKCLSFNWMSFLWSSVISIRLFYKPVFCIKKCISFISRRGKSKRSTVMGLNQRLGSPKKLVSWIFKEFNSKKSLGVLEMQFSVMTGNETFFRGKLRSKCFLFFLNEFFQIWIMNLSWVFKRVLKNRNGCILFSAQTTILNKNIWHKLRISTISFIESLHPYL